MLDREVIDALPHALRCRFAQCQTPKCREVYALLRHGTECQVGVPGGCLLCKKMWLLLYYHALPCQEDECYVPRCRFVDYLLLLLLLLLFLFCFSFLSNDLKLNSPSIFFRIYFVCIKINTCSYFSEIREETKRRVQAEKDGEIRKKAAVRAAPGAWWWDHRVADRCRRTILVFVYIFSRERLDY